MKNVLKVLIIKQASVVRTQLVDGELEHGTSFKIYLPLTPETAEPPSVT